jgi:PAS domain S-box-containing protein
MVKYPRKVRNRLLAWFIIGSLLPLVFLTLALVFYLAPFSTLPEMLSLIRHTLLVPILASFILILSLSVVIARAISRPIKKLMTAVEKIMDGDTEVTVDIHTKDEIAKLGDQFNKMTTEVLKAKQELEIKVRSRTKELLVANEELQGSKTAMLNILEDAEMEKSRAEEQRNKIEIIINSIGDAVIVTDQGGHIIMFNPAAGNMLQISEKSIKKKFDQIINFTTPKKKELLIEEFIELEENTFTVNRAVLKDDKQNRFFDINSSKFRDTAKDVLGTVIVIRDITRNVEIENMKSEFVSVASHQLRTPLSAIRWFLEMMLAGDLGSINDEQKEVLTDTLESNKRMIYLVNDLLNVSRLEDAKLNVEPQPTDLKALLNSIIKESESIATKKNIEIDLSAVADIPEINIDASLIGQVLQNLFSNAVKYSLNNTTVSVELKVKEQDIYLAITDQGHGIPIAQQKRIFEKFFRATNAIKMETEGTGLGLYIAKMLVELSDGHIGFLSEEGKGSTFYFTLPLVGSQAKKGTRTLAQVVNK